MKVKLALLAGLIVLGAVGAHVIEGFTLPWKAKEYNCPKQPTKVNDSTN